ncbi:DUF4422 domain-containing protein [Olsenella sp. KGMB02461]|nr:DUF4422 domain-containing protein [Olsenella sp. KGMB02461]
MPRFSIVVPVFNTEEYLPACLDSLQQQTFSDWEAIVVNDASPDNSSAILDKYASADDRFKVLTHEQNQGRHLTRMDAFEKVTGEYVLCLDSDDTYDLDFLERLNFALADQPVDILHFGQRAIAVNGTSQARADAFTKNEQTPFAFLEGPDVMETVFLESRGYHRDWMVTNRAFALDVVRQATKAMAYEPMSRGEDCYEYFALASFAREEATRNDICGYNYFMGRGIINERPLDLVTYKTELSATKACCDALISFALSVDDVRLIPLAQGAIYKLHEIVANDWLFRVQDADKNDAITECRTYLGDISTASNLMRFVRDRALTQITTASKDACGIEAMKQWYTLAASIVNAGGTNNNTQESKRLKALTHEAREALTRITSLEYINQQPVTAGQKVAIIVSEHQAFASFDAKDLLMMQVGSELAPYRIEGVLHDDEGDNISALNKMYCEMTAQYWAWKNLPQTEYTGFCHYRRYFNFSDKYYPQNPYGEIIEPNAISASTQKKYGLTDDQIEKMLDGVDLVVPPAQDLRQMPGAFSTPYEQYADAPKLHIRDLELVIAVLEELYPEYTQDAEDFLLGHTSRFCNMYIMKNELFKDYAAWLFSILSRYMEVANFDNYSVEALRTPGHLAERLFNIYLMHQERTGANLRIKELQVVHFEDPNITQHYDVLVSGVAEKPVIPVVFATDDDYVPMVSTTIKSLLENASSACLYDLIILHNGIRFERQQIVKQMVQEYPNASVRFIPVASFLSDYKLTTNNQHIGIETYFRFIIQRLLPAYDKVLYLDSDLIVKGDISVLYRTSIDGYLLAATRDIDFLGQLNKNDGKRLAYNEDILGMKNPYDYFQAGVLLLNIKAMRDFMSLDEWLERASDDSYIYNDQDVLNSCCEGHVKYIDQSWNVMIDCFNRIQDVFSFAPAGIFQAYNQARNHELIVHYAGADKPWNNPYCDRSQLYWYYARQTPFYEELLSKLSGGKKKTNRGAFVDPKVISEDNPLRAVLDPILPIGSPQRELLKSIGRKVLKK